VQKQDLLKNEYGARSIEQRLSYGSANLDTKIEKCSNQFNARISIAAAGVRDNEFEK